MATAVDVAAFIRATIPGPLSRMKLLKLVYYAQAWALAWDRVPLFSERIEAWAEGPVVRSLWAKEKHALVEPNTDTLTSAERDTVWAVLAFYAGFNGEDLSEITHVEKPWHDAREGVPHGEKSQGEITIEAMRSYYGAVKCDGKNIPSTYARALEHLRDLEPEALAELLALSGPDGEDDLDVDADTYCKWLETGEGDPCPASLA